MGLMDRLSAAAERAAEEAEKAFDKGKAKVGELQVEMQMDSLAKKLGYLVFDFYRGREVDQALRQKILDDLSRLEDQLLQAKAEAAAKAEAEKAAKARDASWRTTPVGGYPPPATGTADAPTEAAGEAAAEAAAAAPAGAAGAPPTPADVAGTAAAQDNTAAQPDAVSPPTT